MIKIFFDSFSKDLTYHTDRNRFGGYLKIHKFQNSSLDEADIIVIPNTADLSKWSHYKKMNKKIIFDITDAYLVEKNSFRRRFRSIAKYFFREYKYFNFSNIYLIKKICSISDAIVCCSEEQRNLMSKYCNNINIIYDFQDERILNHKIDFAKKGKINLVWEGLSVNLHHFKFLDKLLYDLNKKFDITLNIITEFNHKNYIIDNSIKKIINKIFVKFKNYQIHDWSLNSFSEIVSKCDIALIPLNPEDKMSFYKGANKLILMWKIGLPTVSSAAPDYVRLMDDVNIKLYCRNINEWEKNLMTLFQDRNLIRKIGNKLHKSTYDSYSDKKISLLWEDVIRKL